MKPLIWVESVIERHAHSRVEIMVSQSEAFQILWSIKGPFDVNLLFQVKAKSQFKRRSTANNVEIYIPVPSDADSPKFKTTLGTFFFQ